MKIALFAGLVGIVIHMGIFRVSVANWYKLTLNNPNFLRFCYTAALETIIQIQMMPNHLQGVIVFQSAQWPLT